MKNLTVSQDSHAGMTMVSSRFIDEYMKEANDAQIKIYLYLLRCVDTNLPTRVSAIADYFNYTEKDVLRALQYWDKRQVISLLYDDSEKLAGIKLENLDSRPAAIVPMPSPALVPVTLSREEQTQPGENLSVEFDKFSISLDRLKEFKNREDTSQLLFIVEQYLGKPLSTSDIRSIFFMTDVLHFSMDLVDYLVQYCVEHGKRDFRYIDKVAVNWAENGISTPKQAASYARKYDKKVYAVMNSLGKNGSPTQKEISFIHKWFQDYGFTLDMITEACERSVLATDKHRFEYADGILQSWKNASLHTLQDVRSADEAFRKRQSARSTASASSANPFNQFRQNQYDYDELLQKIKIN